MTEENVLALLIGGVLGYVGATFAVVVWAIYGGRRR